MISSSVFLSLNKNGLNHFFTWKCNDVGGLFLQSCAVSAVFLTSSTWPELRAAGRAACILLGRQDSLLLIKLNYRERKVITECDIGECINIFGSELLPPALWQLDSKLFKGLLVNVSNWNCTKGDKNKILKKWGGPPHLQRKWRPLVQDFPLVLADFLLVTWLMLRLMQWKQVSTVSWVWAEFASFPADELFWLSG